MNSSTKPRIVAAGETDLGQVRKINEDSICLDESLKLYVVADGMGGHEAGEVASKEALYALRQYLRTNTLTSIDEDLTITEEGSNGNSTLNDSDEMDSPNQENAHIIVHNALKFANDRVFKINQSQMKNASRKMGTTIAGLLVYDDDRMVVIFHVGDSRIYRFRNNRLMQLTMDHTLIEKWKRNGMQGPAPAQKKNVITKAVGPYQTVEPDISIQKITPGDLFLICSDGLTGMIPDDYIQKVLVQVNEKNLKSACRKLIELANKNGGVDNISAIVIGCF